jgi:hypothetical protein
MHVVPLSRGGRSNVQLDKDPPILLFWRPGSLKKHTRGFASPRTFVGKAEIDVHGESLIESGKSELRCQGSTLPVGGARLVPPIEGLT